MTAGTIARLALYEEVAERLRARIFAHELEPGAWIDEQALATQYGISRTPLREALKVLAAEGLVTLKPRRGCYVTEITERDLDEIFPLLALLEGRCAAEAARRASAADLRRLDALHATLETQAAKGDVDAFFIANQDFHLALQEIASNRWLALTIGDLRKVLKLTRHHSLSSDGRLTASVAEHLAVLRALRKRDAARAEQAMHAHLMAGRAALAAIEPRATPRRAAL